MTWIRACEIDAVDDGEATVLQRSPEPPVAVFNVGGDFFATDDTCTHDNYSLADGYIDDEVVECPLHMAKFCIRTGKVLSPPATRGLTSYPVKVEDGAVYVDV
ncbi:bifunctional 3-phenylpropionate/cinnamic acid dioxygenase ferredoxin subunit [Actinomadura welshii]|uniref:bifunctional 3-phenylpropionate/cinnamic acid dioxygenase ferredoxin subunit n=1 Tax=Actinomadura welshii TaxID=3103817 RepID=UPI0003AD6D63|nr:bifunctional 3-phenylpropionate/cinnamic acid dioxygenase ferredoxin subunit [Actinomadura madurae]